MAANFPDDVTLNFGEEEHHATRSFRYLAIFVAVVCQSVVSLDNNANIIKH
jgi:hypothetical protein